MLINTVNRALNHRYVYPLGSAASTPLPARLRSQSNKSFFMHLCQARLGLLVAQEREFRRRLLLAARSDDAFRVAREKPCSSHVLNEWTEYSAKQVG